MSEAKTTTAEKPKTSTNPWTRGIVIAAILIAGAFAFPGGMEDWLDERNGDGWLSGPLAVAHGVDAVSSALGVRQAGQSLRRAFAAWVGDDG